ncbi:MBL fold metallo-hydrolase [Hymenobacter properus]|uniref:MBL fold metallo-hydrolase n=1 Tax=Hymenobacter properus TaxID=2791026 RepID=A0A931BG82_9BACT|nr:MBL fold metallo-hydrolase [Hymenobacter properus]MBF9140692.1 MBL fold metallo-hydrolase [Hymenobacter properus]MBR7719500.1 MBL fold metallo-hydrolase [Microvirga sp. SRT04]
MAQRISYLRNPALPTVRPGYPGNKLFGREFANGEELFEPSFGTVLKWQLETNPQKKEKQADTWAPAVVDCTAAFSATEDMLVWLGHASFLLRVNGVTLLFDPVLFSSLGLRHRHALPCPPEAIRSIDYLLLSHGHRDHLDEKSIKLLARQNPQMQVLTSLRMTPLLRGMATGLLVQEAGWWQQYDLGPDAPIEITYLPASHWHRRGLADLNQVLWGSFLIRDKRSEKLIYFAGDTAYADHFEAIEARFGPVDIALMPIGAYKPAYMMAKSHVNPHEAAKAANVLRAGHVVPMHYGTFSLSDEPASEPLRQLQEVAAGGMLRGELHAPAVGEVLRWPEWE